MIAVALSEPNPSDKTADWERLLGAVRQKSALSEPIIADAAVLRQLPAALRGGAWTLNLVLAHARDRSTVVSLDSGAAFAAAVDVGTTNVVASLFDLASGARVAGGYTRNPQTDIGPDVLTRMHVSMGGRGRELHSLLVMGINRLLRQLCDTAGIGRDRVSAVAIAGNTIMTHFLLDLTVEHIPVEPYIPVVHRVDFLDPSSIGLDMNPRGIVYVFPNAGSYVGGDIIAGILSSGLYKDREPSLLIDVGTNAEIVLGCDEWIVVSAGAAGPALEGGIAEIGMNASEGAIHRVAIAAPPHTEAGQAAGFTVTVDTIGGGEPEGLCGSGMIELVCELYRAGVVDRTGKLTAKASNVVEVDGHKAFVIYGKGQKRLILRDTEIDNFLRSKAAMFSALRVVVTSVGLTFGDIRKVYVSGAFGMGINVDKAIDLGMIPKIPRERFLPIGNSSLRGAELLLLQREVLHDIDRISGMITYKEMNTDREFMKEFPAALFIPHTNPDVLEV